MKTVVLFRSASEDYQQAFAAHDFEVIFVEPLQFLYINAEKLSTSLLHDLYSGLILTSPRAIDSVTKCWDSEKYKIWYNKKLYTVGEVSRERIKNSLGLEAVGFTAGNAENLAKIILSENCDQSKFLFPCGNISSETLPVALRSGGIIVDTITVYETEENDTLKMDLSELLSCELDPCSMVFFSPSGCDFTCKHLKNINSNFLQLPSFAIGKSTARKMEILGFNVAGVAAKPDVNNVVAAVCNYFDIEIKSGQ